MAKRITAIVTLSILAVLIVATIVMGSVNMYYGVNFAKPNEVYVQYSSNIATKVDEGTANRICTLIQDASKQKVLTAFFVGELNNKAEVNASSTSKNIPSTSGFKIVLSYNTAQTIKEGNKTYKDGDGNAFTYTKLVFIASNTTGISQMTAYIVEDELNPTSYTHSYVFDADFSALYNYLADAGYNN